MYKTRSDKPPNYNSINVLLLDAKVAIHSSVSHCFLLVGSTIAFWRDHTAFPCIDNKILILCGYKSRVCLSPLCIAMILDIQAEGKIPHMSRQGTSRS